MVHSFLLFTKKYSVQLNKNSKYSEQSNGPTIAFCLSGPHGRKSFYHRQSWLKRFQIVKNESCLCSYLWCSTKQASRNQVFSPNVQREGGLLKMKNLIWCNQEHLENRWAGLEECCIHWLKIRKRLLLDVYVYWYRLAHIVACKGGSGYSSASGFDLRRTVGRLVLLFKNSTRGKDILAEYLEFVRSELENFHDLYRLDSFQ